MVNSAISVDLINVDITNYVPINLCDIMIKVVAISPEINNQQTPDI